MNELVANIHIHTTYSDGSSNHKTILNAALDSSLDVIIITDHNILVQGLAGYLNRNGQKTLMLVGEEVHDQDRVLQKNHLLVLGVPHETACFADDPQNLINIVRDIKGLSFIAHPHDPELKIFSESDISWEDWDIEGYTGIELWNGLSELKTVVKSKMGGFLYAYFPEFIAQGPLPQTLTLWDNLLSRNVQVVAIGGSDSHAIPMRLGPIRKIIFPYAFHFSTINTHLLTPSPLSGDLSSDSKMIYEALASGHSFIGYDLPASTRGFRFSAQTLDQIVIMGDEIQIHGSITLQVHSPDSTETRLLKDGKIIKITHQQNMVHTTVEPGVYRVEVYRKFLGKIRGWIFSNPIYIRTKDLSTLRKNVGL
jgi:hypothetical protein